MSRKGVVDIFAAIIIMIITITFGSTLYLYSSGVIKGTMLQNFELVDIFGNRVVLKNVGREDIKNLKCMVDGIERRCVITEASIIPGQSGNVLIEGITPGIHELQLYTKSMSERLTWKAEENSIVNVPNPTTTTTIIIEETKIIELSTSPDNPQTPQNVTVKCKAQRATGDDRKLHLDIRLNNPSGNEILNSGNLGDDELDITYEILFLKFTETGDYKVICNLRETTLLIDPLIDSKNLIVSYSSLVTTTTTTAMTTTTVGATTTTQVTTTAMTTTTVGATTTTQVTTTTMTTTTTSATTTTRLTTTTTTTIYCPYCPEDLNGDCKVDIEDVAIVSKAYGSKPGYPDWNPKADLNNDGIIDIIDVAIVSKQYGKTCQEITRTITIPTSVPTTTTSGGGGGGPVIVKT